jgi:hypothetical protein
MTFSTFCGEITELLVFSALFTRVGRSRLVQNLVISANFVVFTGISGILSDSSGLGNGDLSEFGSLSATFYSSFVSGQASCSLSRHFTRLRQISAWSFHVSDGSIGNLRTNQRL